MESVPKEHGTYKSFDGTPIYYEVRGEGEPLVFVYGIACLINHWHHQIHYFSRNYKTIAFDLRGHHKSSEVPNQQNLTLEAIAKDLSGLLKHLKIEKAWFLGHSFGAPVILKTYDLFPELFKGMVFINGFSKNPIKGMFGLDIVEPLFYYVKQQYEDAPEVWSQIWKMIVYNPLSMRLAALAGGFNLKLTHFKDIEVYARGVAQMDLRIFFPLFEELMRFNGDEILKKIDVPTLIISGEDDHVTPKKFQYDLRDFIKNSEYVEVPYGSHCTQLDFPDYINLKIEKFIRS